MIEGSGSVSGSKRPKYIRLRIRIDNTVFTLLGKVYLSLVLYVFSHAHTRILDTAVLRIWILVLFSLLNSGSGMEKNPDPGYGIRKKYPGAYFQERSNTYFGYKCLHSLLRIRIRDLLHL